MPSSNNGPAPGSPPVEEPARILIVDDDESVMLTMQAVLEMDGYSVTGVMKGSQALDLIGRESYDLVLTDLRLDDLDGLTILGEVRRRAPETVTIMLTGYASLESAVKALREGAYDYLFKPCDVEELRATVARGLEKRQLTGALRERVGELEQANDTIRTFNVDLQRRIDEATAALRERMDDLAQARDEIATLYQAAQRHVEQLQELDRQKSKFLSMASHELKTPLTAISGFVQLSLRRTRRRLERGQPTLEEWEQEQRSVVDQLEVLDKQTSKLGRLVDELLDVSRIESGRVEFRLEPVDLRELVAEVSERMQMTSDRHTIELTLPPAGQAIVSADRDHIEQVLNNLLSNAIKYSPGGGTVAVAVAAEDATVQVSVRDAGVGIPKAELESIFGLFYRSQEGDARHVGGMGLGLYISREIVVRHGGRIWAESEPGQGSTFYLEMPRLDAVGAEPVGATTRGRLTSDE
jgi:signal transduction histidine kinase